MIFLLKNSQKKGKNILSSEKIVKFGENFSVINRPMGI